MGVGADGIVTCSNLGGEGIGNVPGSDDATGSADVKGKKKKTEHNTACEEVLVHYHGQLNASNTQVELPISWLCERVGVRVGPQVDSGEDIGAVDKDTTDDDEEDQHVAELSPA